MSNLYLPEKHITFLRSLNHFQTSLKGTMVDSFSNFLQNKHIS